MFLGTVVDMAWPVAAIGVVALFRTEIRDLLAGFTQSWTKARMKVGGQEVELERDVKWLEAKVASSVLTTGVPSPPETIGPPPNQDRTIEGTGAVPDDTSAHPTPSPEEIAAA